MLMTNMYSYMYIAICIATNIYSLASRVPPAFYARILDRGAKHAVTYPVVLSQTIDKITGCVSCTA